MLDKYGNEIRVAFAPHEIEWIEAALTLSFREREYAYDDIAAMTGRKFSHIKSKAQRIQTENRAKAKALLELSMRRNWQSESVSRGSFITVPTVTREKHKVAA